MLSPSSWQIDCKPVYRVAFGNFLHLPETEFYDN